MLNKIHSIALVFISLLFIALVFISLLFFAAKGEVFAGMSANLEQTKSNLISLIEKGNYTEAQVQTQKLIANFSKNEQVAEVIHEIAQTYQEAKQYDKAIELSQYALDNWPQTASAIWLQMRIVVCNIAIGNDDMAKEAISRLNSEYSQHPDLPRTLYILADQYTLSLRFKEAKNLYQLIIQQHPDSSYASQAELGISRADVMSLIVSQNYDQAKVALDKLVADFSGHPDLPEVLYWVAERYGGSLKFEDAKRVYQQIIQKHPDSPWVDRAKLGFSKVDVLSLIMSQDYDRAEKALGKLVTDFSGHPDFPEALYWVAERYRWAERYEQAKNLYRQIIQNYPDSPKAGRAKLGFSRAEVLSLIVSQKYDEAKKSLDKLVADFSEHPDFPETLYWIAEGYRWSGRYEEADSIYRQVIQKTPPDSSYAINAKLGISRTNVTSLIVSEDYNQADAAAEKMLADHFNNEFIAEAVYDIADRYYSFGKYEKTLQYLQKIIDNWPNYQYAWSAQSWIGECYEKLRDSGGLSASEANPKIKQAYQTLIERYPDCSLVGHACLKLAHFSFDENQPVEAAAYLELFLQRSPDDPRAPDVLYDLGRAYEQMGELDLAVEVYDKFIETDPNSPLVKGLQKRFKELGGQTE